MCERQKTSPKPTTPGGPMNAMLISPIEFFDDVIGQIEDGYEISVSGNFEQILALAKSAELKRLCIVMGGYNYSKSMMNNISGQKAAEEIHAVNPDIPILIWNGRQNEWSENDKRYYIPEIKNKNEIYLRAGDYSREDFFGIIRKFYADSLTTADMPVRDF